MSFNIVLQFGKYSTFIKHKNTLATLTLKKYYSKTKLAQIPTCRTSSLSLG